MKRLTQLGGMIFTCITLGLLTIHTAVAGDDANDILKKLEKKYDGIKDMTVAFRQEVHYGVTETNQSFDGTMWMKKGNKYRIELEDQTIVTDGISVWSYSKSNNQVIIDRFKESSDSFTPDKVLVNVPSHYDALILGREKIESTETIILKLTPKESKSNLQWMKIWVDDDEYLMKKIQVLDVSDNLTTYLIGKVKLNQSLKEIQFQFDAPAGTELIDLR